VTKTIRVGIVGRQFGERAHAPAFGTDPRCEVVSVAGRDDWRDLVSSPRVDAVAIAVPPAVQPGIVFEAAKRGKHVFCEKPAADSVAAAREMIEAVASAEIVHGIDFIFPVLPSWQRTRRMLRSGAIGRLRHFAYTWHIETSASRLRVDTWKRRTEEGGGARGNFLSHVFHNIEWLVGPLTSVGSFSSPEGARAADAVDGTVYCGDADGRVSVCTDAFLGCGHRVELFGDLGTLVLANRDADYVAGFQLHVGTRESGALTAVACDALPDSADGRVAAVALLARRFIDAVSAGTSMTPNLHHGLRTQELLSLAAGARTASQPVPAGIEEWA